MPKSPDLGPAKRIMAAVLKLPPKQHSEMKVGSKKTKAKATKRKANAKR
jgi:hypothetical protein